MSTNNVDLFSYLPGLEVTENEILEAELAAQQILKAKFPSADMREGTALRDLVIRPSATLLALVNKALIFYMQNNDLAGVTNDTPQVFVDKLLSNWFLTRRLGIKSVINARLYFAKAKSINVYSDIFFSTDGQIKFNPITSVTFAAEELIFDANSNQYYIDVDLIAEKPGIEYNITTGSLLYFTNFDPYFLHSEINYLREAAQDIETNSEFIARARTAISTRNLINVPSIDSNLRDYFSMIDEVKTVGMGDPEMVRDQIKVLVPGVADPIWIHNGGATDVYCRTPVASSIIQLTTDDDGKVVLTGSVYKFDRSLISGGTADDTLPKYVSKSVSSITRTSTTATVTCTGHGYTTGNTITILGANQSQYNGDHVITVTGANTFTFVVDVAAVTPATGTITANVPVPFTWANTYVISITPSAIARVGTTVTVTAPNTGLMIGDRVTIGGATPTNYNGTFVVTSATAAGFTYELAGAFSDSPTGTFSATYVNRYTEYGFSDNQSITVDYGATYANQTVSFTIYYHQNIDGIQAYLTDPARRVVCADPIAKGFNLTMLDITITGYNGPAPDADTCNNTAIAYLAEIGPGEPFVMSDLVARLNAAGVGSIQTPLNITFIKYWKDLLNTTSGTITDTLLPNDSLNVFKVNSMTTTNAVIT